MKRIKFFLLLLMTFVGIGNALADNYAGKLFSVGALSTQLETGKWYFLFNNGTGKFAYENDAMALKQGGSPEGISVSGNTGYMFQLVETDTEGKYFIQTGLQHFIPNPGSSVKPADEKGYGLKVTPIEGTEGHFNISGSIRKLTAPTTGGDLIGGNSAKEGSIGDWSFLEVIIQDVSSLRGKAQYDYVMSSDCFVRIYNKRNPNYLTSDEPGKAFGAARVSSGYSQLWLKAKDGKGYTFLNAETGEYLQEDFGAPTKSAKTLYIQYSPNNKNTETESWCNISGKEDFSGNSCLNLGNDGQTLYKWSYSNDAGSDWTMELVTDISEEEIREHLNGGKGWAKEIEDGAYYRIVSATYLKDMTEISGELKSMTRDLSNLYQCWKICKSGTGYTFQNVVSDNYANGNPGTSQFFTVGKASKVFYLTPTSDEWNNTFTITSSVSAGQGMHTASSQGYHVVLWDKTADASAWAFEKVELSQADIDKARNSLEEYNNLVQHKAEYQETLNHLFEDKACTTLKSSVLALSDEELDGLKGYPELPQAMKDMVLKIKHDSWKTYTDLGNGYTAGYEKFFRIADYQVYSNYNQMCWGMGMSNAFGKLANPTGIVANTGDIVMLYVDKQADSDCTLQLECVSTEGVPGDHQTGTCIDLKAGLNIFKAQEQNMLFIFYQLNDTSKFIADYPDIKIHIEGGQLHGYWDATRGMTNADWRLLQQDLLNECNVINLKTKNLMFAVNGYELKKACPVEMEGITKLWNKVVTNEERYMGLEEWEGRYRNVWNVFSVNYNYMYASTYGTYYNENTMGTIFDYKTMTTQAGNLWGPGHEMGHNHQATINLIGCTEVSNNLFANINVWEHGTTDSRGSGVEKNFDYLAKGKHWGERTDDVFCMTRMYFQLYLYFHVMKNDTTFYPRLFKALRADGLNQGSEWKNTVDGEGKQVSAKVAYGRNDYLKFAKKCCDVAQADLSEFFESYGFFVPANELFVGDYTNHLVTTTEADIKAAKAYMQKYPKKLGNIMFINDRVEQKPADPNPEFCAVASGSLRNKFENNSKWFLGTDELGGDFEQYDGTDFFNVNADYFTISGTTISFKGTGWVGHKFYNKETGNLIWATNRRTDTLPAEIQALGTDGYYVVAAEANGNDVPCPYYKIAKTHRYPFDVYFGNGQGSNIWYTDDNGFNIPLPENAVAVYSDTKEIPENILTTANLINQNTGSAKSVVINGDEPFYSPITAQVGNLSFTKNCEGYNALVLPFDVQESENTYSVTTDNGIVTIVPATAPVSAGSPVVISGKAIYDLKDAMLHRGSFSESKDAFILNNDGKSIVRTTASPFTYVFDKNYSVDFPTGIESLIPALSEGEGTIYNLAGQAVGSSYKGIVIRNGKKVLVK